MAAQTRTTRFIRQTYEHLSSLDLDAALSAYHLTRTPEFVQRRLADVIMGVLNQWALSYGNVPETHPLHLLYQQSALMIQALGQRAETPPEISGSVLTIPEKVE